MMLVAPMVMAVTNVGIASAAPSDTLNFQGRLLDVSGGLVSDGYYNIEFNLYTAASGGSSIWTESREYNSGSGSCTGPINGNDCRVRVSNGYFSVYLGEVTALPNIDYSQQLYLTMNIDQNGTTSAGAITYDGEMNPRFKLTAVPYAFRAANVASGDTNAASTDSSDVSITTGDALGATSDSGDVTIDSGTATGTAGQVLLGTTNASGVLIGNAGATTTIQGSVSLTGAGTALTVTNDAQFNGDVTIGSDTSDSLTVEADATFNGSLTVSTGDVFQNAGATLFSATSISDRATGGNIGTAAATVDIATTFDVNQTTAGQTLTLPTPTNTASGRVVYVNNVGSENFTMYGETIETGSSSTFIWNGSSWTTSVSFSNTGVDTVGALDGVAAAANGATISGTTIYLQSASATAAGLVNTSAQTFAGTKTFNNGIVLAANQTLTVTGGTTANRPGSPTAGMVYYDTDTNTLLTYNGTKWIADRGEYIIVAANDSTQAEKDSADYVADNTDDHLTINSAIGALSSGGGKVLLLPGTFTVDGSIEIESNVTLAGSGQEATTLIAEAGALAAQYDVIENANPGSTDNNITIRDLTIDGNKDNVTGNDVEGILFDTVGSGSGATYVRGFLIENITVTDTEGNGIDIDTSANGSIKNVTVKDFGVANGIRLLDSDYIRVEGSDIIDGLADGLFISASDNNIVYGNFIDDNGNNGLELNGATRDNVIDGNRITNSGDHGIELAGVGAKQYNIISNNYIGNNTDRGFTSVNSYHNTITGNQFYTNDASGVDSHINLGGSGANNVITNNVIRESSSDGSVSIAIASGNATTYVADNLIDNVGAVADSSTSTIYANQMDASDNLVLQASGTADVLINSDTSITGALDVTGAATFDGNVTVGDAAGDTLTVNAGSIQFANNFTSCTVINTDASGNLGCDTSTYLTSATVSLQGAYDGGNTVTTTNARDILFTLADTTTDSDFIIDIASGSTSEFAIKGAGTNFFTATQTTSQEGQIAIKSNSDYAFAITNFPNQEVFTVDANYAQTLVSNNANTAGRPALSFAQDTDTGIYRIGADQIGVSTGGSLRVSVTDATTTVTNALTVTGLTTLNGGLTVEAGDNFTFNSDVFTDFTGGGLYNNSGVLSVSNTGASGFFQNGGNLFGTTATLGTNDLNPLVLRTNSTTALTIDTSQNITTTGNLDVAGRGAFGNTGGIGTNFNLLGILQVDAELSVEASITSVINDAYQAASANILSVNPASNPASSGNIIGGFDYAEVNAANTTNVSNLNLVGTAGFAVAQGSGDIGSVSGGSFSTTNLSTGTVGVLSGIEAVVTSGGSVSEAYGGNIILGNSGSGTISNARGLRIDVFNSGSSITNAAGIVVERVQGTNTTNLLLGTGTIPSGNYSIYSASTAANYFAGNLTLNQALLVNGNTTIGNANTDTLTINAGSSGSGITFGDSSFANCTLTTVAGVLTCGSSGSASDLQGAYVGGNTIVATNAEGDIDLTVSEATNFTVDITGTGNFQVQDGGTPVFTVADGGASTFAGTLAVNAGTITNSGAAQLINFTLGDDADQDQVVGLAVQPTSVNGGDFDNLVAIYAAPITAYANTWEVAYGVGAGYDIDFIVSDSDAVFAVNDGGVYNFNSYNGATFDTLVTITDVGSVGNVGITGTLQVDGLTTLNGGLTIQAGDTFNFNSDAFSDFTGGGLYNNAGVLSVTNTGANGFFQNGGNSFGVATTIGTNDAQALGIETGGTTRFTVAAAASTLTGNGATTIFGGTSLYLGTTGANSLTLATNGTTRFTVANNASTISGNGATSLVGGTTLTLNAAATSALNLGTTQTTGILTIGGTGAATGAINLGTGTGDQTINLATGSGSGNKTVTLGANNGSSSTTVRSGSGGISLQGNTSVSGQLTIGQADTTGTLLVLDTKTDLGDPSGVNGALYYNSNIDKFRCYENGSWVDCMAVVSNGTNLYGGTGALSTNTTGYSNVAFGQNALGVSTTGWQNVAVGVGSLFSSTGNDNIAIGFNAGDNLTSGNGNIIIGSDIDFASATGFNQLNIAGLITSSNYTSGGQFNGTLLVTGLTTLNGGLTVEAGDTFTFNSDAFTDFTGGGLVNTGGVLSVDTTSAAGFFRNGGNSFSGTATLGTNNANSLVLETNNQSALTIANGGAITLQNASNSTNAFRVNTSGGASLLNVDTTNSLVTVATPVFQTVTNTNCGVNCTITQSNVDNNSAIIVNATAEELEITLPDPTNATAGRVVYVTAANGSNDFTLLVNGGGQGNEIAMRANTTATMIWNGNDWTAAGASSSTTLQAAYDNTLTSAGGAEIVLSAAGGNADGLTVRNNATAPIIGGIFEAQTSIGSNLFSVNNNATEFATNGGAETDGGGASTFPVSTWDTTTGGTVDRYTTAGDNVATGQASVRVQTTGVNHGARNRISTALTSGLTYTVSFAVRATSSFSTLDVLYSPDGSTSGTTNCATGQRVTSGQWTRITCTFVAGGSINSNNSILIRQSDGTSRTFYIDNLSINVNASASFAADGSVDVALGSNWTAFGTLDSLTRETSVIYDTSGSVAVDTPNAANRGVRNNLSITPDTDTQYLVSFYARSTNTFNDIRVRYSRNGGSNFVTCEDYNTQSISTTGFTKVTCLFTTDGTTASNPDLIIDQPTGSNRIFYIDALTVTLNSDTSNNVQIGGGNRGGPVTLFTLDRSAGAPIADNNEAYLGSMYYDTTTGRIQCYEADGWGACGAPPDNVVNLNPEYAGSVLNGSGVGTMTADFCSNGTDLTVNTSFCDTGEARNFYNWTSPQATEQTYSIYVTYQLPETFNGFSSDDTVQLVGRVDNTSNASVTYEMFHSTGSDVTQCGTGETNVITGGGGSADTWYSYGINGNESTGCALNASAAGDFIIFKINLKAQSNANAYVSTLSFVTTGR